MDDLRGQIWDLVFRSGPQTVSRIADELNMPAPIVEDLVGHVWFSRQQDLVRIAISKGGVQGWHANES